MPAELLSTSIVLFLPSFPVSLSYLTLTFPMRKCSGERTFVHQFHIFYTYTEWNLFLIPKQTTLRPDAITCITMKPRDNTRDKKK